MAQQLNSIVYRSTKADGTPNALGTVSTYLAGSLTPAATFTTQAGDVANTNPVTLGADGCGQIWLDPAVSYRFIEADADGATIRDVSGLSTPASSGELAATSGAGLIGFSYGATYGAGTIGKWLQDLATTAGAAFIGFLNTSTTLVATTVQAALAELGLRARVAQNILPNTRWYVMTGHVTAPQRNESSSSTIGPVNVTSYTTAANTVVCLTADTSSVEVGRLVSFASPADANLRITALRVLAVVANTSFTVRLPNGLTASTSSACTATPILPGGSASAGSGLGFDGWTKSTTLQCWRDSFASNIRAGSKYAAGLLKGSASAELYHVSIDSRDLAALLGREVTVGGWVKCPAGGTWRCFTADSVNGTRYGSAVTTTGYTWAEFTFTVPSDATSLSIGFEIGGASGLTYYLSDPVAGVGNYIGEGWAPVSLSLTRFIPVVKFTPQSFFNANVTLPTVADAVGSYGFTFDVYAETNGNFAPEVKALDILLEGFNASAVITGTGGRALASRDVIVDPIKYGPLIFQQVASVKTQVAGVLTLASDGTAYVYGPVSGDNWANVSMDINGVYL